MREEVDVWGENSDIKAGPGMMGSDWKAMGGMARQGRWKNKGALWGWKTPGGKKRLQPGHRAKKSKNSRKIADV